MKKEIKIIAATVAATLAGVCAYGIYALRKRYKEEADLDKCTYQDCDKCQRQVGQCEEMNIFLNWKEACDTLPVRALDILSLDSEMLKYRCLEYLSYDIDRDIIVAYSVKCQEMVYIKINYDAKTYCCSGRKETLC